MLFWLYLFYTFCFKLTVISSFTVKFSSIGSIVARAMNWAFCCYLMRNIAFFIFSLINEFVVVRLVGVPRLLVMRFALILFIVDSIGGLQEIWIVMILIDCISAFMMFLYGHIVGFIHLVVGRFCLELDVSGRAVMFSQVRRKVPHEQIQQMHFLSDYSTLFWNCCAEFCRIRAVIFKNNKIYLKEVNFNSLAILTFIDIFFFFCQIY